MPLHGREPARDPGVARVIDPGCRTGDCRATRPPRVWLQASTATIYAHRYDAPNDEFTGILGGDEPGAPETWRFSIAVASAWERAFDEAATDRTRKVALRSAITLSPDRGGIFDTLLGLTRRGLGGRAGNGRQFMSWIHYEDFVAAVPMADRSRRCGRRGQRCGATSVAERRVHAGAARSVGDAVRPAGNEVDAGDWRSLHAHGDANSFSRAAAWCRRACSSTGSRSSATPHTSRISQRHAEAGGAAEPVAAIFIRAVSRTGLVKFGAGTASSPVRTPALSVMPTG